MSETERMAWQVLRAQTGDREALNELLETTRRFLHRYVLGVVGDSSSADDVLQETLVRIYRKLPWLDDAALFRPWAFRIASREAFRIVAKRREAQARDTDDTAIEALPAVIPDPPPPEELGRLLQAASPASRAVLLLHYQDDLTINEVAAVLGISPGTVKSRLAYGLRALRQAYREAAP
jgi:RNA polymerase sigma-70 factor (ECF subfamily)